MKWQIVEAFLYLKYITAYWKEVLHLKSILDRYSRKKPHPLPKKREYNKGEENSSIYIFQSRLLSVISHLSC